MIFKLRSVPSLLGMTLRAPSHHGSVLTTLPIGLGQGHVLLPLSPPRGPLPTAPAAARQAHLPIARGCPRSCSLCPARPRPPSAPTPAPTPPSKPCLGLSPQHSWLADLMGMELTHLFIICLLKWERDFYSSSDLISVCLTLPKHPNSAWHAAGALCPPLVPAEWVSEWMRPTSSLIMKGEESFLWNIRFF